MSSELDPPELPDLTFTSRLGRGGFSEVFLYQSHRPRRPVAVKVLRTEALTEQQRQMFHDEADAMAELSDHEFIVSVYSVGTTRTGQPYIVMQYCPPPDLGALVAKRPMDVAAALRTGIQVASAVESAHQAGILHRDVKPANILRTRDKRPALTDFGIAGRAGEAQGDDVGVSIPWTAPEVLGGQSNGTISSDVYSLGATVHHLLVGHSPFQVEGPDPAHRQLVQRIFSAPPPPIRRPDVPQELESLLARCLAKSPDARPASALELAKGLRAIEEQLRLPPTNVNLIEPSGTVPPKDSPGAPASSSPAAAQAPTRAPATDVRRPRSVAPLAPVSPAPARAEATSRRAPRVRQTAPEPAAATGTVRRPQAPAPEREELPPARPPRWAWVAAAAALVAVVVAGLLVLLGNRGSDDDRAGATPPDTSATPDNPVDQAAGQIEGLQIKRVDDAHVRVSWTYEGVVAQADHFAYQVDNAPPRATKQQQQFVVLSHAAGSRLCVQAWLQQASTNARIPDPPARRCGGA